jgi:hypothetical protein
MPRQLINALDDAETWGGLGTVFRVPGKYTEALTDCDDLMLEVPGNETHVHVSDLPGVIAYDVGALLKYYLHQKNRGVPRDPKTRRLLMDVERP